MSEADADANKAGEWKRGLPPGRYYDGMVDDFEVYFSPAGVVWHRRREPPLPPEPVTTVPSP